MSLILITSLLASAAFAASSIPRIRMDSFRMEPEVVHGEPLHVSVGLRQKDGPGIGRVRTHAYLIGSGEFAQAPEIRHLRASSNFADMTFDTSNLEPGDYLEGCFVCEDFFWR